MKKFLKRGIALVMFLSLLLAMLAGCGGKGGTGNSKNEDTSKFNFTGKYDFKGETITIKSIWPTAWGGEETGKSENGDLTNEWRDAVQKAYNCKIATEPLTPMDTANSLINRLMSGDKIADIIDCHRLDVEKMRIAGDYLVDLKTVKSIDFANPLYNKQLIVAFTYNAKAYAINSDLPDVQTVLHVNMDLLKTLPGLEDPFKLALENKWTFDKFFEFCKAATKDINGDGEMDDYDQYGAALSGEPIFTILNNAGIKMITKKADGSMEYTLNNQNTIDIVNLFKDKLVTPKYIPEYLADTEYNKMFTDGRLLMVGGPSWYPTANFAEVEFELGLLPFPVQKEGMTYSTVNTGFPRVMCIPSTNKEPEAGGAILEAMTQLKKMLNEKAKLDVKEKIYPNHEDSYKIYEMMLDKGYYEYALYESGFSNLVGIPIEGMFIAESSIAEILEARDKEMKSLVEDVYNKKK